MLTLGIDPGLALTGWALIEGGGGRLVLSEAGYWRTPANQSEGPRLLALSKSMAELLQRARPQAVAVERLYFSRNVSTAMAVSQARGVLVCAVAQAGLTPFEYTPGQVKQAVSGAGAASKTQVARMVGLLLGVEPPRLDDVTDACAVAICHLNSTGLRAALIGARS